MIYYKLSLIVVSMFMMVFFLGCDAKKEAEKIYIKQLVAQKCSICHFSERIYKEPRSPREWTAIVDRMQKINPTLLKKTDSLLILEYLKQNVSK